MGVRQQRRFAAPGRVRLRWEQSARSDKIGPLSHRELSGRKRAYSVVAMFSKIRRFVTRPGARRAPLQIDTCVIVRGVVGVIVLIGTGVGLAAPPADQMAR